MATTEKKDRRLEWGLVTLILVLLALIVGFVTVMYRSNRPYAQAEEEATAIAKKYTDLTKVSDFYWFTRDETYFSLLGADKKGNEIAVIVPKDGNKVTVLNQKDGLSELAAMQNVAKAYPKEKVKQAKLGIYKEAPVWEVTTTSDSGKVNYVLVSFDKGEEIKKVSDI